MDYANQSVTLYNTQIEQRALTASWEDVHIATFGLDDFFMIWEYLSSSNSLTVVGILFEIMVV